MSMEQELGQLWVQNLDLGAIFRNVGGFFRLLELAPSLCQ
jgi:hypothetical protein